MGGGLKVKFYDDDDEGEVEEEDNPVAGLLRQTHPVKFANRVDARRSVAMREEDGKEEMRVDYSWEAEPVRSFLMRDRDVYMSETYYGKVSSCSKCSCFA